MHQPRVETRRINDLSVGRARLRVKENFVACTRIKKQGANGLRNNFPFRRCAARRLGILGGPTNALMPLEEYKASRVCLSSHR
jgi:hypothetical protein